MQKVYKIATLIKVVSTKKRVAAYARISSRKDESLHSLSAQISHYSAYISIIILPGMDLQKSVTGGI